MPPKQAWGTHKIAVIKTYSTVHMHNASNINSFINGSPLNGRMISLQDRELTKAASIRADFARDLEEVTSWLGGAEARVLDRGAEPTALKVE